MSIIAVAVGYVVVPSMQKPTTVTVTQYLTTTKERTTTVTITLNGTTTTNTSTPGASNISLKPGKVVIGVPRNLPSGVTVLGSYRELESLVSLAEAQSYASSLWFGFRYGRAIAPSIAPMPLVVTPTVTAPTALPLAKVAVETAGRVPYSLTNVQVAGVDEADIVKTDGKYIYLVSNNKVYVIEAFPPSNLSVKHVIKFNERVKGIFIYGNRLVVICEKGYEIVKIPKWITTTTVVELPVVEVSNGRTVTKTLTLTVTKTIIPPVPYVRPQNTTVYVFKVDENVKRLWNITLSGSYVAARMINGTVYLISQMRVFKIGNVIPLPIIGGVKVDPRFIVAFRVPDVGYSYTTILALNVSSLESKAHVFLVGQSSNVYVSHKNIYILSRKYVSPYVIMGEVMVDKLIKKLPQDLRAKAERLKEIIEGKIKASAEEVINLANQIVLWLNKLPEADRLSLINEVIREVNKVLKEMPRELTTIYRFSIKGLDVVAEAVGTVPGAVMDQFSMDEYGGYFRIATTVSKVSLEPTGMLRWTRSNNIYVLDMNLTIVGRIEDLAVGERVYAARYLGDLMYLVTFRRVDPLFGIDLSDPKNPKVLGFLKIPGYSEYLHPYGDKYLIGVGVAGTEEGRGIKVSLFDISDPRNITEVSKVIIKDAFWSPLFSDHKAFLMNTFKDYIAFPIYGKANGLAVIKLSDGRLSIKGLVSHGSCIRALYIGDYIYSISHDSVKAVSDEDLSIVGTLNLIQGFK